MYPNCTIALQCAAVEASEVGTRRNAFCLCRHIPECDHKDDLKYRRCRCPKWIDGYVDGKRARQSAPNPQLEQAERKARLIEDAADPSNSVSQFLQRLWIGRGVLATRRAAIFPKRRPSSRELYFRNSFPVDEAPRLIRLRDLTPIELVNFRATWANNGLTANRKLSRLWASLRSAFKTVGYMKILR